MSESKNQNNSVNPFKELAADFLLESRERLTQVEETLLELRQCEPSLCQDLLVRAQRGIHTLKGNAGMMGYSDLQNLAHEMEDQADDLDLDNPDITILLAGIDTMRLALENLARAEDQKTETTETAKNKSTPTTDRHDDKLESVRVPFTDLDELVDVLAEMVIFRNRLRDAAINGRFMESQEQAWDDIEASEEALGGTLNVIQERIMSLRMVPLKSLFVSLKRIVHDVQADTSKNIHFETRGGETPMDKALLEVAAEALGHLVRNAAIHGIEDPEERLQSGKAVQARIHLSAVTDANEVVIDIEDDGRGVDPDSLVATAQERGIDTSQVDDPLSLLFHAGLSTHEGADLGAGRGIGLAAALESVKRLGGRITVASQLGRGSRFRLHLPLSVSITRALLIEADGVSYALPIAHIDESLRFSSGDGHEVNHSMVFNIRGEVVPLIDLGIVFGTKAQPRASGFVVMISAGGNRRGLLVDKTAGIREIVVKGLDSMVGSPAGVSGSTILGDGRVVLILDASGLVATNTSIKKEESDHERTQNQEQTN